MADPTLPAEAPQLTALTASALKDLVGRARPPEWRAKRPKRLAVFGRVSGLERVDTEEGPFEVVTVRSELDLREKLFSDRRDDATDGRIFVLSWPEAGAILPLDLRHAFAGARVLRLVARERLEQRLSGRRVTEDVASSELGQLLDAVPTERFPRYDAPTIDKPGGWRLLLGATVGLPIVTRPDGPTFILWALVGRGGAELARQIRDKKRLSGELEEFLSQEYGALSSSVWKAVEEDRARTFVVAGVVVEALLAALRDPTLSAEERGAADLRLKELQGEHKVPGELLPQWGSEAAAAVRDLALRGRRTQALDLRELATLDPSGILRDCDQRTAHLSEKLVARSDLLPRSRAARLGALSRHAVAVTATAAPTAEALETTRALLEDVQRHVSLAEGRQPAARASWALARLLAYLICERRGTLARAPKGLVSEGRKAAPGPTATLTDWASYQVEHGGAVDRALREVASLHVPELLAGTNAVRDALRATRARANRAFAERLQSFHSAGAPSQADMLTLDELGTRYVARFLDDNADETLFVLLLDGLSLGVSCELFESLRELGWGPASCDWATVSASGLKEALPRPVLSALPSITSVSRSAFFAGEVPSPGSPEPGSGQDPSRFAAHASLARFKPELFLKNMIGTGTEVSPDVTSKIRDPRRRLVGAVVNAVDDWLSGPQQVAHGFDVDVVKPLRALLSLCHEAGRTVLIVSDHGHTIDESLSFAERSEHSRWRTPGEPLVEGELLFSGPHVWCPPGAAGVVLPYLSGATYKWKKVGHHGGATLEEVVVPAVFIEPNGSPFPMPHWWQLEAGVSAPAPVGTAAVDAGLGETLFAPPVPRGGLSARFVASAVWKEQKARLPGRFQEEKLYALLDAMERRPRLSGVEFTEITGEREQRMAGFASQAGFALNAGGAEVLVYDREARRLVLDVELLGQVFEVDRG